MPFAVVNSLLDAAGMSPPVDLAAAYDPATLAGKTILVTGGASGFGAAFARHWARHGAFLVIGDIDDAAGEALVAELRAATTTADGTQYHHFQHCDVRDWASQAALFRAAVDRSPTGGIDAVVPNAGIVDPRTVAAGRGFENPLPPRGAGEDDDPRPPRLDVMDINVTGVLYTVHLALHWLPRNMGQNNNTAAPPRDRHILLISSIAGILPLPGQPLYTASKHAVTGLFRALRGTGRARDHVRVNLICPYFAATPLLEAPARLLLAGGGLAGVEDVLDAATRLMADTRIAGRALAVGPRMVVGREEEEEGGSDEGALEVRLPASSGAPAGQAVWECYAEDYENSETFVWRFVRLINAMTLLRGWTGFLRDVVGILWPAARARDRGRPKAKRR